MITRPANEQTAVSPVVAVILLVAVTVTLSAVIGGFALEIGQSTTSEGSQQKIGVSTSQTDGQYTATIVTGSADEVKLLVNGSEVDNISNPSAGDTLSASTPPGSEVTIITISDGSSTVTSAQTVDGNSSTTADSTTVSAPTDGLFAHWKLDDDTTPDTAVDSVNTFNGTILGSAFNTSTSRGTALEHGTNDTVDIGSSDGSQLDLQNSLTVSAWVKTDVGNDGKVHNIYVRAEEQGADANPRFRVVNGSVSLAIGNESIGTAEGVRGSTKVADGSWHHVVGVFDNANDTVTVYVDGQVDAQNASFTIEPRSFSETPTIGFYDGYYGNKSYWQGHLDDMRVYNRPLNQSEVGDLYNATK